MTGLQAIECSSFSNPVLMPFGKAIMAVIPKSVIDLVVAGQVCASDNIGGMNKYRGATDMQQEPIRQLTRISVSPPLGSKLHIARSWCCKLFCRGWEATAAAG